MNKLPPSIKNQVTKHLFLSLIKEHTVFKGLNDIYEFLLDNIEPVQYLPEQYIIKEGTKGTHLYILEQGMCEVLVMGYGKNRETFVRDIGPGVIFGEVALLFDTPRTASIRSKYHCTLAAISQDAL